MRHTVGALASLSLFVLSLTGCGKSMPTSPIAPATAITQSSAAAARISGSVTGAPSGLASSTTAGAPAGLMVTVTGTSVTSGVDATGRFSLISVPPGSVELHFTGPGVDAKVPVGTVASGDSIEVHVTVTSTTAEVEDTTSDHDSDREIEGRVEAVPPVTAAGQFNVAGATVTTNASTIYKLNGHTGLFTDILVGVRVHVKAQVSGTTVTATEVDIQNEQTTLPVEINGVISALAGTAAAFTFDVGTQHLTGGTATVFEGGRSFSDLHNGAQVEIKGALQNGAVFASSIHINGADNGDSGGGNGNGNGGDDNHGKDVEVSGAVTGLAGTCPAINFSVGTTKVVTTATTRFDLACTAVTNTTKVDVTGTRAADGTVTATRVKKD
jgi:hypothetical protein